MTMRIAEVKVTQHTYKTHRRVNQKSRMYFWPKGETLMEQLFNRHSRPHKEFRKFCKLALVEAGYELSLIEQVKFRWSKYAGCSCPCSPGFILSCVYGKDFHVSMEMEYPKLTPEENTEMFNRLDVARMKPQEIK